MQSPPPHTADPLVDPGEVLVAQGIAGDVAQDDRVVGEQFGGVFGEPASAFIRYALKVE